VGPFMCAGVTVYNALRHSGARGGDVVAVLGVGGLGHLGVQYARQMGFETVALGRGRDKESLARKLGAHHYIDSGTGDAAAELQKLGGAQVILATAPSVESINQAFGGLAPDGTIVVLGVGLGNIEVNPVDLVMGRRRVLGSPAGSLKELRECMELAAKHNIRPKIHKFPIEAAEEALREMQSGHMNGRAVLAMG